MSLTTTISSWSSSKTAPLRVSENREFFSIKLGSMIHIMIVLVMGVILRLFVSLHWIFWQGGNPLNSRGSIWEERVCTHLDLPNALRCPDVRKRIEYTHGYLSVLRRPSHQTANRRRFGVNVNTETHHTLGNINFRIVLKTTRFFVVHTGGFRSASIWYLCYLSPIGGCFQLLWRHLNFLINWINISHSIQMKVEPFNLSISHSPLHESWSWIFATTFSICPYKFHTEPGTTINESKRNLKRKILYEIKKNIFNVYWMPE